MGNLTWLRSRIWIALALPLGAACEDDRRATPRGGNAGSGGEIVDRPPPRALDAEPAGWEVTEYGCGGESWCAPPARTNLWAATPDRQDGCATKIVVPAGRTSPAPPEGEHLLSTSDGGECCFRHRDGAPCRGRPFLDGDRAVVADADAAGDEWIAAALDEHASVASFARATLELMAVGAPPALLAGCQRAALDEIVHAQGCFAMAARHGRVVEPGPIEALAPRGGGLAAVARDTFLEGCVGETIGAAIAAEARDAAADPEERALLARIADDEARHAELAWQTVAWAVAQDPSIAAALRDAADRARTDSPVWRDVIDPALQAMLPAWGT